MALSGDDPGLDDLPPDAPVVALRALGLGDLLTAVPALRGLRRRWPGRRLLLAADGPAADLLARHGIVDEVLPTPGLGGAPPGRGLGPHVAVNLHGRGPQSHRLLLAGDPVTVLAHASPAAGVAGPAWDDAEHEVERWCRLVRSAGGRCGPDDLRLGPAMEADDTARDDRTRTGPVVVHPGAASAARRWPADRFAAVAAALRSAGERVVVTGAAAETWLARTVTSRAGLPASCELAGRLTLTALTDLLRGARLLLCGDTGVAHLATAIGTPSVLLFGPSAPSRWGPAVDAPLHRVLWPAAPGEPAGDPHAPAPDPVLLRITTDDVLAAADPFLSVRVAR